MKVRGKSLLLLACLVWGLAGGNILLIGLSVYPPYRSVFNFALSALVFVLFARFVFGPLVRKHMARIRSYGDSRQFFLKFFDLKSFIIMAIMMSGGMALRRSASVPRLFIAVFYTGLGAALLLAGLLFGLHFVRRCCLSSPGGAR